MSQNDKRISALKKEGLLQIEAKRLREARDIFAQVCSLQPADAEAWSILSAIHGMLGNIDAAGDCCRKVIALQPQSATAHSNLGNAYTIQGRHEEAQACYHEALRLDPRNALAHCNLGYSLESTGRSEEAIACYCEALRQNPGFVEALNNLGNIYSKQSKLDKAMECHAKVLQLMPHSAQSRNAVGGIYVRQGMLDDAMVTYREALYLDPGNAVTYCNLGNLLKKLARTDEAAEHFQKALQLNPDLAEAHLGLGNVAFDQGHYEEALAHYTQAQRLNPNLSQVYNNLAGIYVRQGNLDEALENYQKALQLNPDDAEAHSNLLFMLCYRSDCDKATLFDYHVQWGEIHGSISVEPLVHDNTPDEGRELRIGYICADFRNHPVGYFIENVLAYEDKTRITSFCYSNNAINDDMTLRLQHHADCWRDIVGQTDEVVASRMREDRIDILVDLAGHTAGNRLLTLALKPAPVQVTWMSYIATTGLKTVDHIIADRYIIPPGDEKYYVEEVVRLPNSYLCFAPPRYELEVSTLPALDKGGVTFGCFNNTAKLTPSVIAVWAKLLVALPGARLFLKSAGFGSDQAIIHYQDLFASHGVHAERLVFAGGSSRAECLAAYNQVDIGLDPFPYNGGTTTAEALWMGVPVITLRGDRFVSRVGESFIMNLGLKECVADSEDDYIAKAVALASDLARLADLRRHLRGKLLISPLCDAREFASDLEAAYRKMWKKWCLSQKQRA